MDTHVEQLLAKYSGCPPELNKIILYYVQRLHEEQYRRGDLKSIEFDVHCEFMLKIKIFTWDSLRAYEGEVDVIRVKHMFPFEFRFTMDGTHYTLIKGRLYDDYLTFNMGSHEPWIEVHLE